MVLVVADPIRPSSGPKVGSAPLIVSGALLLLNFLIGETIFANVIVLFFAFLLAIVSFSKALIAFLNGNREPRSLGIMIGSAVIIGVIVFLVATDNIAMGYGP